MTLPDAPPPSPRGGGGSFSLIARIYWMLFGIAPIIAAVSWIFESEVHPSSGDALYWAGIVAMIGVRWLDLAWLGGTRADGEPATPADGWRYAQLMLVGGGIGHLVIHLVASRL